MKKIINGKKYDTATAKKMDYWSNGCHGFNYTRETLYRKKTGEYFLHGEGGASSRYCEYVGDGSVCGGERIMPLTEQKAREWAEEHLTGDEYEAIFGEVEE